MNRQVPDLARAMADAIAIPLGYASQGRNLAWAAMAGATELRPLVHHPRKDVVDPQTGCRFFYHGHDVNRAPPSWHGHFHLFIPHPRGHGVSHLGGLALDAQGLPQHWFSTNQWVTGEHWASARQLINRLKDFEVSARGRLAPVARWLSAFVALEHATLELLLNERDTRLARLSLERPRREVWADRRHHILSRRPVAWLRSVQAPPLSLSTH